MTPEQEAAIGAQAVNQVIDQQIGSACRTIAQQAGAVAVMQAKLAEQAKEIEDLKKPSKTLESVK